MALNVWDCDHYPGKEYKVREKKMMNFAVMKSGFGGYWIGKTKLETNGTSIFSTFDEAMEEAKSLNDSVENLDELEAAKEEDVEELRKEMEKWIV